MNLVKRNTFYIIIKIVFLCIITNSADGQNYAGIQADVIAFTGYGYEINEDKLYFQGYNLGVACIDLTSNNLIGVLPDTDLSSNISYDFKINDDKIYKKNMEVYDKNSFELIEKLPYGEVVAIDVTDEKILTLTQDNDFQIINKFDYSSADTLEISKLNEGEIFTLRNGYLVLKDEFNTFTFYNEKVKVSSFKLSQKPQTLIFSGDYLIFEFNRRFEVYNIWGNKLFSTSEFCLSNLFIDESSNYVYLNHGKGTELVQGNLLTGKQNIRKVSSLNPKAPWVYDIIGIIDNRYIVYDRHTGFIYSYSIDFVEYDYITKFNGPLQNFNTIDNHLFDFAVVTSGRINTLTLIDVHTLKIKRVEYENQADPVYHPIHPFELNGNNLYLPVKRNGLLQILDYNINTNEYKLFGDFGSRITSIYADEENNKLYVGEYEVFRSSFDLRDNSFIQKYFYSGASYLDITKVNGNVYALTEEWGGINFIDFETNELYTRASGSNSWRFGTQFNYSENGELFISVNTGVVTVHNLLVDKKIAKYELDIKSRITSLAVTNNADFIVIGTENEGVYEYTPATNKLVRSNQNRLIPTNNYEGRISYSQVNDIVIDELKNKYHFIVRDLVFATADYEVLTTSVEKEFGVETLSLENGILNLNNFKNYRIQSICNINGNNIHYSMIDNNRYTINSKDAYLFLNIIENNKITTYKLIR